MEPSAHQLCEAFLGAAGAEVAPSDDLATALIAATKLGEAAWPTIKVDRVAFAAFLGQRIPSDVDAADALRKRAVADLYLVHACLEGGALAISCLENRYLKELPALLARHRISSDLASEVTQELRMRLLTGERQLLVAYGGTGELRGWLRVTAMRMALRARRRQARYDDEEPLACAVATAGPDLEYQRKIYRDEFRAAFSEALASLSIRERNLLKQSVLYGATNDDLAALYHVHRTTAARWLVDTRAHLASETRSRMVKKLDIDRRGYDSILRLIVSQLDVSVANLLASPVRYERARR